MFHEATTKVYFSNQVELLVHPLRQQFLNTHPLCRRLIIVPSPAMKSWLTFKMAQEDQIAMGFETTYLDQGIHFLRTLLYADQDKEKFPTQFELALALEWEIRTVLKNYHQLSEKEQNCWKPLSNYLKTLDKPSWSKKSEKRLCSLTEKLARLFIDYGISGGAALSPWQKKEECWQAYLWRQTLEAGNEYGWSYPYRALTHLQDSKKHLDHIQVHLFAMSYLPPLYHTFLQKISKNISISFYLLSPCEAFWSDICSDKETQRLQSFWEKKEAPEKQQIALEEFLRDRNPLLANFGRIGREMAQAIENAHPHTHSCYAVPACSANYSCYEDQIHPDFLLSALHKKQLTLLEAVQTDITLLRNPENNQPIELAENDRSIQIHAAPSTLREVQILHDRLLQLISEHSIQPKDWVVMAPDIRLYAPFIKMVFGAKQSPLNFLIMDAELPEQNAYIQTFLELLNLSFSRWDSTTLLNLFEALPFRKKCAFTNEEIDQIRTWIREMGIRWGVDGEHRKKILQSQHCRSNAAREDEAGTWENGFQKLLKSFVFDEADKPLVDTTTAPLLGRLIFLIRSLHEHLRPLQDESVKSASEWVSYLKLLAKTYLEDIPEETIIFEAHLLFLQKTPPKLSEKSFPFRSIHSLLQASFRKESVSYRETQLQAIKFCSMLPMRAIPARGIALLGLQEGAFPRYLPESSLHLFAFNPLADYSPTQVDFDRYLFLETLISARDYFLISYQEYSSEGNEQPPSLLVQELLAYLDKYYRLGSRPPSDFCHYKHPFHSHDSQYFMGQTPYPSYSESYYRLALASQHQPKTSSSFISASTFDNSFPEEGILDIKYLLSLAKNPLEHFFNQHLEIYLEKENKRKIPSDDSFSFNPLSKALMKKEGLKHPIDKILLQAEEKGDLPSGYFKGFMTEQLVEEIKQLKLLLAQCGVSLENVFQIELSESTAKPIQLSPACWSVPPLEILYHGKKLTLVGTLPDITPQGLLAYIKDDKGDVMRAWPSYILLNCLAKQYPGQFGTHLIFAKSGTMKAPFFENPFECLESYLDYFFMSREKLSILLPQWIPDLIENPDDCNKRIPKSLSGPYSLKNDYAAWVVRDEAELDFETLIQEWKEPAARLFSPIFNNWYPARKKREENV